MSVENCTVVGVISEWRALRVLFLRMSESCLVCSVSVVSFDVALLGWVWRLRGRLSLLLARLLVAVSCYFLEAGRFVSLFLS